MVDTKISAYSAVAAAAAANEFVVNEAGTTKKASLQQIADFLDGRSSVENASVSQQTSFATDAYLVGSSIAIPSGGLKAKTMYRCRFQADKNANGVAAPVITVRFGTNGSTADTGRGTLTFLAQTAVADSAFFEVLVNFRTVGGGTSAVIQSMATLRHRLSVTGFSVNVGPVVIATSGGFDSTVANSIIGISVNAGASAAWVVDLVQAELVNLVW